ncbi:MAG: ABC transporter permease subunit [Ardenticatenaceae bacterium]|nr:ABC transporter permease subunit [Ardenticatenaceae bacterium]
MNAELSWQKREGTHWVRGLAPLLGRENRKWWHGRRWIVQLLIWVGLLDGLLAFALYVLPQMAVTKGVPIPPEEALGIGKQMFFGLGAIGLAIGAIVLLQDAIIEEKSTGTAEWVLSKPVSRSAYVLSKLLPNLLALPVVMLLVPGTIGYFLFRSFDGTAVPLGNFLISEGIVAVNLLFYITLTLLLGVLLNSRAPLLGIALGSLLGGSLVPIPEIIQFTPWKLGELVLLPVMGQALPLFVLTMLVSTVIWSIIFVAVAIWKFNNSCYAQIARRLT